MCGIAAVINPSIDSHNDVVCMLERIHHRGPDSATVKKHTGAVIGFNRLAITDADVNASAQPGRAGKTVVYFNGEIYNYKSLPTYKFGMTEVEVLASMFDKFGPKIASKLNGMFSILLMYKGDWYAIRDRYGIKPMYYWVNNKQTYIVSEIKSLTALSKFKSTINTFSLSQWTCMNNIVSDSTIFSGVYHVPAGSIVNLNKWTIDKYWTWNFSPQPMSYEYAVKTTRELVIKAIQRQTPTIAHGTCLSGGVDSGIIRAVLGNVPSFSVGYSGVDDERDLINIQQHKGYHIVFSQVENLEQTMYHLENPRVGASWPNYGLYELASKFVRVLFDGAGADELFGGYHWRYEQQDYQNVLSRTGQWNAICQQLMDDAIGADTIYDRYKIDADWFLPGVLEVVDKLSMAHSVEIRVPFLDNDLVDFAQTIPAEYKLNKQVLKDAFSDMLPPEIISGAKKGFTSPDWLTADGNTQAQRWNNAAINELTKIYFQ